MPWGSLCVLCGLCVLLSCPCCLLTPLQPLPWLCIPPLLAPPSPYHGCCAPSEGFMATPGPPTGPQPPFPGHPVPSSWSHGLQCWCSRGRWMHRCWSVIGCSWLLVGSSGNSVCDMELYSWVEELKPLIIMSFAFSYFPKSNYQYLIFCCDLIGSFINWVQLINIKWCKTDCLCQILQSRGLFSTGFTPHSAALWGWIV